ncbi:MAG: universal stress protein [Desulfatirhabdiaceae bacterium]
MAQKILVPIDDSSNALRVAEFIATVFNPDNDIILFSILPDTAALCDMNSPELTPYFMSQQSMFCQLEDRKKQLIDEAMVRAKDVLIASGFSDDRISLIIQKKKNGVARDIVDEAKKGYQIIVMGRRGLSGVQEFLMGSVSQKVIHAVKDVSIVIVN